ncbi:MAG: Cu(I)-responsive transcriptional regulator [Rhodospirillaceae bacterium]|jgi:Cu(I)-responsive transcriptional regulator|nr:Cu(I)-responsive transcriptional regulator [Rhodospirillaceae bacterium]MBT5245429.1 Cu(I)-responsive transcriptional regulator [Rhodospirillaceae bacterium]MBT5562585.1 Cu(I)-responsive transcriptional regulator [Rhodospirillaceae bacterium]MBT6242557.1 Cu(I)-responsive transcriptional regulator [Rhodospirillaceae bacterium]MBT7137206.1 Cu(I)-responsive transcriptional regulator [Rhodospirillaceae bacterium]
MNIGSVSEQTGVPAKTIRYYEEIGLIPAPIRAENGYRHYQVKDVETLRFVQRARGLGFSVKDVGNLLTLWQDKNRVSSDVKNLAIEHIKEIEDKIEELNSIRETLISLTNNCHGDDRPDCPILDGLTK